MTKAEHEAITKRRAAELREILRKATPALENEFGAQDLLASLRSLAERMEHGTQRSKP